MRNVSAYLFAFLFIGTFFTACEDDDVPANEKLHVIEPGPDAQSQVQEIFITMSNGDTVEFKAGTYDFTSTLSIDDKEGIVIRGAGAGTTILDFGGQTAGAQGIQCTETNWLLIHDLTVQDTEGDGIKVKDSDGISFFNVAVVWTGTPGPENGAYGLYPVSCSNVLIDNCYVTGASDAGIYVGQCDNAIIRNSTAEFNVAGFEVENTTNADVYNNLATRNTGGILIFDLPGLPKTNGANCRVFDNEVIQNDYENFAPEGNIVGEVPSGTGIMVMAAKNCEIFNNTITNNNAVGTATVSYLIIDTIPEGTEYDPYVTSIYVHNNTYSRTNDFPPQNNEMGILLNVLFLDGDVPDLLYDGFADPLVPEAQVCFQSNVNADFADLDFPNDWAGLNGDITPHDCSRAPLPAVQVVSPSLP